MVQYLGSAGAVCILLTSNTVPITFKYIDLARPTDLVHETLAAM